MKKIQPRDPEDRFDDLVVGAIKGAFRLLRPHAWSVAERVFKLVSWLLAIGAFAVVQRHSNHLPGWVVPCLLVVWAAALFVTIMEGMEALADRAAEQQRDHRLWWYLSVSAIGIAANAFVLTFLLPSIVKYVEAVLAPR